MEIHHSKHHNTYVTNLNVGLEKLDAAVSAGDVSGIIGLQGALKFNGGGHVNHSLFWENLAPSSELKEGSLKSLIEANYGSVDNMKEAMSGTTVAVQGSGWGWLGYNTKTGKFASRYVLLPQKHSLIYPPIIVCSCR
jgi:Fe-Mn family superoxide dismutase